MGMLTVPDFIERINELVELTERLAAVGSPTHDKAAVDSVGAMVAAELRALGAAVIVAEQIQTGNHIVARWGWGRDGLLLLGHLDTVLGPDAARLYIDGNRLYGVGVGDMKGGIAMALVALRTMRQARQWPLRPITFLLSGDTEQGSRTAQPLIEKLARDAAVTLCLEPCLANGALITSRRGVVGADLVVEGEAAEDELRQHLQSLHQLVVACRDVHLNCDLAGERGGRRVTAHVEASFVSPESGKQIAHWIRQRVALLAGNSLQVLGSFERPPLTRTPAIGQAFQRACALGAALGLKLAEGDGDWAADAAFVAVRECPLLDGLGAPAEDIRTPAEHIYIDQLAERTALLAAIISEW